MTKIDDKEFFDVLYAGFTKTTRAEDAYWAVREDEYEYSEHRFEIYATPQDGEETHVAWLNREEDADWIAALAGCFPDLVRRLHAALDEADRADREHDEREQEIGRLSLENQELKQEIADRAHTEGVLHDTVIELSGQLETQRSKAADVLWKSERWT